MCPTFNYSCIEHDVIAIVYFHYTVLQYKEYQQ